MVISSRCRQKNPAGKSQAQKEIGGDTPVVGNHTDFFHAKEKQREEILAIRSGREKS